MSAKNGKKGLVSLTTRKNSRGFIFVAPWIAGFLLFFITPFIQTVIYSFSDVTVSGGVQTVWVGFKNYVQAVSGDAIFIPTLSGGILSMLIDTPVILVFSLMAASLISRKFKGRWLVRMVFFLPVIYGTGVMLKVQQSDEMFGIVLSRLGAGGVGNDDTISGALLQSFNVERMFYAMGQQLGVGQVLINYILDASEQVFSIINRSGVQILIFLAALKSIPPHLYEVGKVEGASAFEMFWKVTLPMLLPHIITVTVFTIVDSFTNIENTIIEFLQNTMFTKQNFGYGSALSLIYFASIFIIIGVIWGILTLISGKKGTKEK